MNTSDFRLQVQETIRVAYLARLERYLELVDMSTSPEDHRKCTELLAKLADAFPDKENAHQLPVVHINFGGSSQQPTTITINPEPRQLTAEETLELTPSAAVRAGLAVNLDVEPLLLEASAGA